MFLRLSRSRDFVLFARCFFAAFSVAVCTVPLEASLGAQTPSRNKDNKGVLRWPDGSTITVYIPPDPDGKGRDAAIKKGMLKWNDTQPLKDHNIKIDVKTGPPPTGKDATNSVVVKWADPGSVKGGNGESALGATEPFSTPTKSGNTVSGAMIDIDRDTDGNDTKESENLGTHEMGHALGLDDEKTAGVAMNPNFTKDSTVTITAHDQTELNSVFAANANDTQIKLDVAVIPVGPDFLYQYTANWLSGGNLSVFQIDTHGANIFDITPAVGWRVDDFSFTHDLLPFSGFAGSESFLGFVHSDENAYLDADHPTLVFSYSSTRGPGEAEAFLNGRFTTIGVTTTPEPGTASLIAIGIGLLTLMSFSRKSRAELKRFSVRAVREGRAPGRWRGRIGNDFDAPLPPDVLGQLDDDE